MKCNTSFYLKNMALAGPSLVFLVSRLITASPGPPKYHSNVTGCSDWLKESGRTDITQHNSRQLKSFCYGTVFNEVSRVQ